MATSEQNSQTHDHDNLDYSVPFSVFLCMQKEVALLLSLIGISALPKTSGSGVLLTQPASFALHALFLSSWPVRTVSSRIYLCFSANFKSSIVLTTTVSIASAMHSKALRQPNITLHYIYVYFIWSRCYAFLGTYICHQKHQRNLLYTMVKIVTYHVAVQRRANMQVTDYTPAVHYTAVLIAVCPSCHTE